MKKLVIFMIVFVMACIFNGIAFAALTDGLVAFYPFNGDANDESCNGYNGVVNGAVLTTDRFGNTNSAYSFDGIDNYIGLANTSDLNFTSGGFTLAAWVNFTADNNDKMIVSKHIGGYSNSYFLGTGDYWGYNTPNKLSFFVDNDPRLTTSETYNDGNWHFVAGVYDGSTQYLYVDGVLKVSQAKTYSNTNNNDILIGRTSTSSDGGYFNGIIDDVRIYNRPLSDVEIQELYNMTNFPVSGYINLKGSPIANRKVTLKQKLELDKVTYTNSNGCYRFENVVPGKNFKVIIQGPRVE